MAYEPDAGVLSAHFITFSAATTVFICRLACRKMTHVALWFDDYFAMVSWASAAVYFSFATYWTIVMGLGRAKQDVPKPAEEVEEFARLGLFVLEFTYAWSLGFSKLAILCLYWRLFSVSNIRLGIYGLAGCTIIWLTIRTFITIFHCVPVEAYWNHRIEGAKCRIDPSTFMFGTTLVHLLLEIAVLLLPVFQVAGLKLRLAQKFAVVAMFMFGIFVCAASLLVLVYAMKFHPKTPEMARDIRGVVLWAGVEAFLAIVSSCLPVTRPIFRLITFGSILGSRNNTGGASPLSNLTNSKGIKLPTSSRSEGSNDDIWERQLTRPEDGPRGDVFRETYAERSGHNSTVVSCVDKLPQNNVETSGPYGIQVKNETHVRYESI